MDSNKQHTPDQTNPILQSNIATFHLIAAFSLLQDNQDNSKSSQHSKLTKHVYLPYW